MNELHAKFVLFQLYYPEIATFLAFALKSTGIVALGALAAISLRRRAAAARSWVWRATLMSCLALPLFQFSPGVVKDLRFAWTQPVTVADARTFEQQARTLRLMKTASKETPRVESHASEKSPMATVVRPPWEESSYRVHTITVADLRESPWSQIETSVAFVWWGVAGLLALISVVRIAAGCWRLRKNSRETDSETQRAACEVARRLGVKAAPRVWSVTGLASPLMVGWWTPTVYWSPSAGEWNAQRREAILLHELTHWKRGDHLWQQVGRLIACAFWWQPLVAWAVRQMNAEAEEAADDVVVLHQSNPETYATTLVEIASGVAGGPSIVGMPMIGYRSLEKRIRSLLRVNPWRGRIGKLGVAVVVLSGLLSVATASFYIGSAASRQDANAAAAREKVTLTSEQRAVLERLESNTLKRLAASRFLHFQLEETTLREQPQGIWRSPQPTKMEAWVDQWTGVHRVEYRPWVLVSSDRPGNFSIRENTAINDGESYVSYEDEGELDHAQRRKPEGLARYLGLEESTGLLHLARVMLKRSSLSDDQSRYTLQQIQWKGRTVWQLREQMFRDGSVGQQRTFLFDPEAADMVVFGELLFPAERPDHQSRWEVQEIGRTSEGLVYASAYQRSYASDAVKSTSLVRVTKLEVLAALPEGITRLPQSAAEKYLVRDGTPKRYPHLVVNYVNAEKETAPVIPTRVHVRINTRAPMELRADAHGKAVVPLPEEEITFLEVSATTTGFVSQSLRWRKQGDALQLPERYTVNLSPGSPIFGKVVDEEGRPVAGAELRLRVSGRRQQGNDIFRDGINRDCKVTTDAAGMWRADDFPADLTGLSVRISAPGYQSNTDVGGADFRSFMGLPYTALRDGSWVYTLLRGKELRGTVLNADGAPLANARLVIGRDIHGSNAPTAQTTTSGEFVFKGLPEGPATLTIEAVEHKPWTRDLVLPFAELLVAKLEKGNVLRARVVGENGKPCAGLNVNADTWGKLRTLNFSTARGASCGKALRMSRCRLRSVDARIGSFWMGCA